MTINLTFTENRAFYNDYYKPIICTVDKELPAIKNGGYNNYHWSEDPEFIINGFEPLSYDGQEARRIKNFLYISEELELHTPSGQKIGCIQYYKTIETHSGKICTHFIQP